jgi:hypothetical protein
MVRVVLEGSLVHHVPYPSWTWLGWNGFVGGNIHNEGLADRTRRGDSKSELVFYSLMSDGTVRPVGDAAVEPQSDVDRLKDEDEKTNADPTPAWKGVTKIGQAVLNSEHFISQVKSLDISGTGKTTLPVHDTGRLVFWTSHAQKTAWLKDYRSDVLYVETGDTVLEIKSQFATDVTMSMAPRFSCLEDGSDASEGPQKHTVDFIVISRFYDISMPKETGKLNVMIVKESQVESGVWSRIGLAVIEEADWLRFEREWEMVILE